MTLGLRERDAQSLQSLSGLPDLLAWFDSAHRPAGITTRSDDGDVIARAYDVSGKLAPVLQATGGYRPMYLANDKTGGQVVNVIRNPSCVSSGSISAALYGSTGAGGSSVAYDTLGHFLGRSIKFTYTGTVLGTNFGRKWPMVANALPSTACVVYGTWWVRSTHACNYYTFADGITGFGGGQGLLETNVTPGIVALVANTWTKIERWWNVLDSATNPTPRAQGFGGYATSQTVDSSHSIYMAEGQVVTVSAVGVRPPTPSVHCDPTSFPGRYTWQGTAYNSPIVTKPGTVGGLYFDGVDDNLPFTPPEVPDLAVYCAFSGLDSTYGYQSPWTIGRYGSTPGTLGPNRANSTNAINTRIDVKSAGNDTAAPTSGGWDGTPHIHEQFASLTTLRRRALRDGGISDSADRAINTSAGSGSPATTWGGGFGTLGGGTGAQPFAGVLHGLAIFSRYPTVELRRKVELLFSARYGTPISPTVPT